MHTDPQYQPSLYTCYFKRSLDFLSASILFLLLSPLILITALLVRIRLGSPVLFRQVRPGLEREPFTIFKFRTMTDKRNAHGELLPDGERLTAFGTFLRKSSLDELPQLLNVIKGDMSLVGPRPLLMRYRDSFDAHEQLRFAVRPGISGLAQVKGRNHLSWDERIGMDLEYVRRCTLAFDLHILLLTAWRVFHREGVHADPGAVMLDLDEERRLRNNAGSLVS